jgi:hypothetical protein
MGECLQMLMCARRDLSQTVVDIVGNPAAFLLLRKQQLANELLKFLLAITELLEQTSVVDRQCRAVSQFLNQDLIVVGVWFANVTSEYTESSPDLAARTQRNSQQAMYPVSFEILPPVWLYDCMNLSGPKLRYQERFTTLNHVPEQSLVRGLRDTQYLL